MTYKGRIKDGVIVLNNNVSLPEGTEVDVEPVSTGARSKVWDNLLKLAGKAEGFPEDAAKNVDHYLYGNPKK
jgi:hypothetical protein